MAATNDNTIILIPSYNVGSTIGSTVSELSAMGLSVLVVDDGSGDDTSRRALDAGAFVLRNPVNVGKGGSIKRGSRYIFDKTKFEWVVLMDGDGQHHSGDVIDLMGAAEKDEPDMVIGNRMTETRHMPFVRYATNKFMSWVISGMCRQRIPDSQCGFRMIRASSFKDLNIRADRFDIESEMLMEAAKRNMKIVSVPVKTIYGDEVSQIHPVRDTIRFFRLIFRYFLGDMFSGKKHPASR